MRPGSYAARRTSFVTPVGWRSFPHRRESKEEPQSVVAAPIPGDGVDAGRGGVDYLLGGESGLLSSRSGGDAERASTLVLNARRRVSRPSTIAVTGRLSPARGNERVTVSALPPGSSRWQHGPDGGQRRVHDELAAAPRHDDVRRAVGGRLPQRGWVGTARGARWRAALRDAGDAGDRSLNRPTPGVQPFVGPTRPLI
jgi:hypothetical protein